MSKKIVLAALSTIAMIGLNSQTMADNKKTAKPLAANMEKCYGISKAGKNDCANESGACPGSSKKDNDKAAWIALPKGTCDKIVGGSTKPIK